MTSKSLQYGPNAPDSRAQVSCHFFLYGNCRKGQDCPFFHDEAKRNEVHQFDKFIDCRYHLLGRCSKGDKCPFLHRPLPKKLKTQQEQDSLQQLGPLQQYQQQFLHPADNNNPTTPNSIKSCLTEHEFGTHELRIENDSIIEEEEKQQDDQQFIVEFREDVGQPLATVRFRMKEDSPDEDKGCIQSVQQRYQLDTKVSTTELMHQRKNCDKNMFNDTLQRQQSPTYLQQQHTQAMHDSNQQVQHSKNYPSNMQQNVAQQQKIPVMSDEHLQNTQQHRLYNREKFQQFQNGQRNFQSRPSVQQLDQEYQQQQISPGYQQKVYKNNISMIDSGSSNQQWNISGGLFKAAINNIADSKRKAFSDSYEYDYCEGNQVWNSSTDYSRQQGFAQSNLIQNYKAGLQRSEFGYQEQMLYVQRQRRAHGNQLRRQQYQSGNRQVLFQDSYGRFPGQPQFSNYQQYHQQS
eukprot:TRINITY_DN3377_c0_g2_i1.p1 TRINITY_DN3377_c0_g2~~TRINITY_DN3377_c0_g2_i1.p1  ORF type:complete len:461 (-),score=34.34 TRINITY_DN3377_c0_g2_i1:2066-3448(-)